VEALGLVAVQAGDDGMVSYSVQLGKPGGDVYFSRKRHGLIVGTRAVLRQDERTQDDLRWRKSSMVLLLQR